MKLPQRFAASEGAIQGILSAPKLGQPQNEGGSLIGCTCAFPSVVRVFQLDRELQTGSDPAGSSCTW